MVSIRKAKKLGIYKKPSYDKKLYMQTVEQVNKVKINLLRDLIHDISMQFVDASVDEKTDS